MYVHWYEKTNSLIPCMILNIMKLRGAKNDVIYSEFKSKQLL